jgi:hypothetical protein
MPQQQRASSTSMRIAAIVVALASILAGLIFAAGRATASGGDLTVRRVPSGTPSAGLSDVDALVNFADDVFVGRVLTKVGQRDGSLPQTRFRIEVMESFKGDLGGEVIVNQPGGYRPQPNELVLSYGDSLLEPGTIYLIAVHLDESTGLPTLIPVLGDVPIHTAQHLEEIATRFRTATADVDGGGGGGRFMAR